MKFSVASESCRSEINDSRSPKSSLTKSLPSVRAVHTRTRFYFRTRTRRRSLMGMLAVGGMVFSLSLWMDGSETKAAEATATAQEAIQAATQGAVEEPAAKEVATKEVAAEEVLTPETPAPVSTVEATKEQELPAAKVPVAKARVKKSGESVLQRILPDFPSVQIFSPARTRPAKAAQPVVRLTTIVGGKTAKREVALPPGATVRQALKSLKISLKPEDRIFPALDEKVYSGIKIRVTRVQVEIKTRTTALEPGVRYKPTSDIAAGEMKTISKGKPGAVEVTERVWSKDGKVTLREPLSRKVARAAQDKIIALGVRPYYRPGAIPYHKRYARAYGGYNLASRGGSPRDRMRAAASETLRPVRSLMLTATGYSPDPRENGGYTTTATGLPIGYGAAAVDPRVIPLGTKLYVEGYGYAFACDIGGAIKGHRIDLAYDSYRYANTKGRKKMRVWILEP